MISISRESVPQYLRSGSLFKSLDESDNGSFEIPSSCYKDTPTVESEQDLIVMLQACRFWDIDLPFSMIKYIVENTVVLDLGSFAEEFPEYGPMFQKLSKVKQACPSAKIATVLSENLGSVFVRAFHHFGCLVSAKTCEAAACVGDIDSLMYLHTEGCPWDERTITAAASNDNAACFEYALDFNCPVDENLVNIAAQKGNLSMLILLRNRGVPLTSIAAHKALLGDHVACLRYLHAQGCVLPTTSVAAFNGAFECLKYLHEQGVEWEYFTCRFAASRGYLNCLSYARTHGAGWGADCPAAAATCGQLDCLIYLHENGCVWTEDTLKCAILSGSWSCALYAFNHQCPMPGAIWFARFCGMALVVLLKVLCFPNVHRIHDAAQVAFFLNIALSQAYKQYGSDTLLKMGHHWTAWWVTFVYGILKGTIGFVCAVSLHTIGVINLQSMRMFI